MNLFWAGSYSAFKGFSVDLRPGEVTTLRYTLAAVLVGFLWPILPGNAPRGANLIKTALMGILVFSIGPRLQVLGVQLGKAGDASILIALEPLITGVAAAMILREHIPSRRWIGFGVGISGVLLLNKGWLTAFPWASLGAQVIFLSSLVCEAAYSVIGKPILESNGIVKVVAVALGCGTLFNLFLDGPVTWSKLPSLTANDWLVVGYLGVICTLVGYSVWYVVIRETDVSLAALTLLLQPAAGVLIAFVALAEPLHWGQLWGSIAIILGLIIAFNLPGRRPGRPSAPEPAPPARMADDRATGNRSNGSNEFTILEK
jgi:drug/metabolite transporter (DMT)-like permease